ncbi:hypothetical protein UPYG_G00332100 [Umbra pygmaea]|uniref:Uncharacterized protein n=1 Tax=Umbra pygmaea TaxID=75934 RepID=A0ABD0VZT3_UMBPY
MVVYLRKNIRSLFSVFKKKGHSLSRDQVSSHYQDNVFTEGRRPQHIEDLHSEARQGLKILQQEEHQNGVDFQEDHINADVCSKDSKEGCQEFGSAATAASSCRPVLTRQGSTFKPLNPVKPEKAPKRNRRTTIMGIPQQIQRELDTCALHRDSGYEVPSQLPNGSGAHPDKVVIPTIDGETSLDNHAGARVHLSNLEASREDQLLRHHLQNVYRDEQGFTQNGGLSSLLSPNQRPKSLAVPGMTSASGGIPSFLQEPQGPVMSISPQATYLSKIIPNAYLPAGVDVIQIDRSGNNSTHGGSGTIFTHSKSSLTSGSSASPASSRRSGGNGCFDDGDFVSHGGSSSRDDISTVTPHSVTSVSCWSHSQSSETIRSNLSSISSTKGSFGPANLLTVNLSGQERWPEQPGPVDRDVVSLQSSTCLISSTSKGSSITKGPDRTSPSLYAADMSDAGGDSCRFSRNLSIMKTKLPPAPPRRTNSLHHEKMRRPQELVEIKDPSIPVGGEDSGKDTGLEMVEISKELHKQISKGSVPGYVSTGFDSLNNARSATASSPLSPTHAYPGGSATPEKTGSGSMSPQKALSEGGRFDRTLSPSSGYSSQSGTPTLSPKGIYPSASLDKQKKQPATMERSKSRASASSSLNSLSSVTSEHVNEDTAKNCPIPPEQASPPPAALKPETLVAGPQVTPACSPASMEIRRLLNIPPPPNVKAPSPPPPETWANNRRTIELLCPPPSPKDNRLALLMKQQQLKGSSIVVVKQEIQNNASKESQGLEENQEDTFISTQSDSRDIILKEIDEPMLEQVPEITSCSSQGLERPEMLNKEHGSLTFITKREEASVGVEKQSGSVAKYKDLGEKPETQGQVSLAMNPKKEPPPVMKKRTSMPLRKHIEFQVVSEGAQLGLVDDLTTDSEKCSPPNELEVIKQLAIVAKEVEAVTKEVEVDVEDKEVKVITAEVQIDIVAKDIEVITMEVQNGMVADQVEVITKKVEVDVLAKEVEVITEGVEVEVLTKEVEVITEEVVVDVLAKEVEVITEGVVVDVLTKEVEVITEGVEVEVLTKEVEVITEGVEVEVLTKEVEVITEGVEVEVLTKEVEVITKEVVVDVLAKEVTVITKDVQVDSVAMEVEGQSATNNTDNCPTNPESSLQTLHIEHPMVDKVSPPASPPPAHHPPPPPSKTLPSSLSTSLTNVEQQVKEEILVVESSWPPPPPPEEATDSVFDDPDDMAFPPPPPPFMPDILPDKVERCHSVINVQDISTVALDVVEETVIREAVIRETVTVETADLSPILAQSEMMEDRPKRAFLDCNAVSMDRCNVEVQEIPEDEPTVVLPVQPKERESEVNQFANPSITMQNISPQPKEMCPQSQEVQLLPEDVPPASAKAALPLTITTTLGPLSNVPPPPPINVVLPTPVQFIDQTPSEPTVIVPLTPSIAPFPPPLPAEHQPLVTFRRQPSFVNRETKAWSNELLSRHKSAPIPKEDANIPLVTPSLLQMVRLRSVNVGEDQVKEPSDDNNNDNPPASSQSPTQTQNPTPQKPIRKSLSLKSTPPSLKSSPATLVAPSMRLQEAIRMKTAAMSSRDGLPTRFKLPSSTTFPNSSGAESGMPSPMSLEAGGMLKSPTSTASFIFSKTSKKVIVETPVSSTEVHMRLQQSLAVELKQDSDQSKASTVANVNVDKAGISKRVPPPVAKKPIHATTTHLLERPVCSTIRSTIPTPSPRELESNRGPEAVQSAGQQALPGYHNTNKMETSNILEAPLAL